MTIEREIRDNVAIVTLNRPEAANTLDTRMRRDLVDTWAWVDATEEVRAVVLTGAGDRAFCAGSDLRDDTLTDYDFLVDELYGNPPRPHFMRAMQSTKPTICAVNGFALGGGLELALATDIRIASTTATFGFPEVTVGSMPGAGGTQYLTRLVGWSDATHLLLTGERISAQEAHRIGLVTRCVEPGDLLDHAVAIGDRIAANAPLSVRATLSAIRVGFDLPLSRGLEYERHLWGLLRATQDRAEGRRAFGEKRPPRFIGR